MHLYAAFLGGELPDGRMGEDHKWCSSWRTTPQRPSKAAKQKWGGGGRGHVDAVTRLDMIDGYAVSLQLAGSGDATEMEGYN